MCNDSSIYENNTSFKIKKVEDLVCLSKKVNEGSTFEGKTIYLLNNIDFNDDASYTNANSQSEDINGNGEIEALKTELTTESGFNPIGTSSNAFAGTFDGYAFTISNLYINRSASYAGLFGYVNSSSALIKGINLDNANITGGLYVGGIVGCLNQGKINDVTLKGTITGDRFTGGIVGQTNGTSSARNSVTNALVNSDVTAMDNVGGVIGKGNYTDVTGIVESGKIKATDGFAGTVIGYSYGSIPKAYVSSDVVLEETSSSTSSRDGTSYSSSYKNEYVLGMFDDALDTYISGDNDSSDYYYDYNEDGKITLYSTIKNPLTFDLTGSGTSDDPYIVNNIDEFKQIALKNNLGYYYELNNDIDFKDKNFYPLGTSTNKFDSKLIGNGHTLSNIDTKGMRVVGIIGTMNAGILEGLNFENITLTGSSSIGIIGEMVSGEIKNINIKNINITNTGNYAGSLVGKLTSGTIEVINSENVNIEGTKYTGGLVGYSKGGIITEATITGNVTGTQYTGGIAGYSLGASSSQYSIITGTLVNADIIGTSSVGGIVGYSGNRYITTSGIVESGSIEATTGSAGTAIGYSNGSITIYTSSDVTLSETSDSTMSKDGTSFDATNSNNLEYYSTLLYNNNPIIETSTTGDINETGYVFDYYTDDLGQQDIHLVKVN